MNRTMCQIIIIIFTIMIDANQTEIIINGPQNPQVQPQYIELNETTETTQVRQNQTVNLKSRKEFLVQYYRKIQLQFAYLILFFQLGSVEWIGQTVVDIGHHSTEFRWTFYIVVILLILLGLGLPIIRQNRLIVQHQSHIFRVQSVLLGFLLIGVSNYQIYNQHFNSTSFWIETSLFIFMFNNLVQIFVVRRNLTHYGYAYIKWTVIGFVSLNACVALSGFELDRSFAIAQAIILYSLYYFNQLNATLLKLPHELPEEESILDKIQNIRKISQIWNEEGPQKESIQQLNTTHYVVNRKIATLVAGSIFYLLVLNLCILFDNTLFLVIFIVLSLSLLSLVLNIQIASKSLQQNDVEFAVCLTYMDLLSPFKNIIKKSTTLQ
ncbi:unnamed protein product (macronuclear) [Paramecium tetraurelia]|uniref:Uncharacterized protein n=1 Tax=Paramecium tetraurelia TaxID=5888 RepID=A0CCI2_PARTE|nr:uncharacterized protein GSPATT00037284001 [Paramecium tetraurelia]CAK68499.1 unnamed protein product [Paramecium tetraurelia]|eukprot:XP_001435896.1 hypothetical protein (macronuclear) [Paramecium tetraurelia strain d4-2]